MAEQNCDLPSLGTESLETAPHSKTEAIMRETIGPQSIDTA